MTSARACYGGLFRRLGNCRGRRHSMRLEIDRRHDLPIVDYPYTTGAQAHCHAFTHQAHRHRVTIGAHAHP